MEKISLEDRHKNDYFRAKALGESPKVLAFYLGRWSAAAEIISPDESSVHRLQAKYLITYTFKMVDTALSHHRGIESELNFVGSATDLVTKVASDIAGLERVVRKANKILANPPDFSELVHYD